MPIYTFEHKKTGDQQTLEMKIAERETWLDENPEWFQCLNTMHTGDPLKLGVSKNPRLLEFQKYVLPGIKKASGRDNNIGNGRWDLRREV